MGEAGPGRQGVPGELPVDLGREVAVDAEGRRIGDDLRRQSSDRVAAAWPRVSLGTAEHKNQHSPPTGPDAFPCKSPFVRACDVV